MNHRAPHRAVNEQRDDSIAQRDVVRDDSFGSAGQVLRSWGVVPLRIAEKVVGEALHNSLLSSTLDEVHASSKVGGAAAHNSEVVGARPLSATNSTHARESSS